MAKSISRIIFVEAASERRNFKKKMSNGISESVFIEVAEEMPMRLGERISVGKLENGIQIDFSKNL